MRGLLGPKGNPKLNNEGEDPKASTDEQLNTALKTITKASAIKLLSTPDPPPPAPDPTQIAMQTLQAAREMSKEEREDRRQTQKESGETLAMLDQQRREAEEKQRLAEDKATEANFGRQKDFLGFQIGEIKRTAEELLKAKEGGNSTGIAQKTNELKDAFESMKAIMQMMTPPATGTAQSGVRHFVDEFRALEELKQYLVGPRQDAPMVRMSDMSSMPAPYAIELRKIELEDARIREMRKEELQIERQKKDAQEGLIGLIMGVCGSFLNSVGGAAAAVGSQAEIAQPAQSAPQPEMVRIDCQDCKRSMTVPKAQASLVQICPFCGPKVIEREVVRNVPIREPQQPTERQVAGQEGDGSDGASQANIQ